MGDENNLRLFFNENDGCQNKINGVNALFGSSRNSPTDFSLILLFFLF
jgi:hypothetical protein